MPGEIPKPTSCSLCPLYGDGLGFVPASGSGTNRVLLVGEAADENEEREGRPFIGPAGWYLDRLLRRAGLDREAFRIHNVLSCRPPDNRLLDEPYEADAINHCRQHLDATIEGMDPVVEVAMGTIPLRRLTGGAFTEISRVHGFVLRGADGRWVVPVYHPSYLLPREGQANTSRFVGAVIYALRRAVRLAAVGFSRSSAHYLTEPSPESASLFADEFFAALREDPTLKLSWDIETDYKMKVGDEEELSKAEDEDDDEEMGGARTESSDSSLSTVTHDPILRISFAFRERYAMSVPWTTPYLGTITRLLLGAPAYITWNGAGFDVPRVEAELGVRLPGRNYDFMWAWHILQSDLPRGLEAVAAWATDLEPWKHLADAQPEHYSAIDADAALRNAVWVERELRAGDGAQWRLYEKHVVDLDPVLAAAGRETGVNIDGEAQNALRQQLETEQAELDNQVQLIVPESVKPFRDYRRRPKGREYQVVSQAIAVKTCSLCGKERVNKRHPCLKEGATIEQPVRAVDVYRVIGRFNPNSTKQLLAYIRYFKHPWAVHRKTGKISVPKKHLQRLDRTFGPKGHSVYKLALRQRGIKKTLGTYVYGLRPDATGRIYTTYTHAASTGRLTSREVNLQNISHRGSALFAQEVRRTIIPPPGWVFVEADSSAVEAVMTGWFMGDADYVRIAKQGVHDALTCLTHGLRFPEDINLCKTVYKNTRDRKKVVVHGSSYGMTPRLLYYENYETFTGEKQARDEQKQFLKFVPGLEKWQDEVRREAHKKTFLTNPWGRRHYFYDVFGKAHKDGKRALGTDAKRCIAFLPQSSNADFSLDNALLLARAVPREWVPANFLCHDSYLLQCPRQDADYVVELLAATLTRPITEMGGLTVGCEISIGEANWGDMTTVRRISAL